MGAFSSIQNNVYAPKDESNRFQQLTITKKKLQEYFRLSILRHKWRKFFLIFLLIGRKRMKKRRGDEYSVVLYYTDNDNQNGRY